MKNNECVGLGGFPPLYKITDEYKKKREFSENISKINIKKRNDLNILNVADILHKK